MFRAMFLAGVLWTLSVPVHAASLSVSPIKVEVVAPGTTSIATLKNTGNAVLNAQVRVFRWSQENGRDKLTPTEDVVASPPVAAISPGREYHVRLVRVARTAVAREESYRMVVDELPDANRQKNGAVAVVLRYTVPVFFVSPDASQPQLTWHIKSEGGRAYLAAVNSGDKRARIANLSLGTTAVARGLSGYVLGHSTRLWPVRGGVTGVVKAQTEQGPISASLAR